MLDPYSDFVYFTPSISTDEGFSSTVTVVAVCLPCLYLVVVVLNGQRTTLVVEPDPEDKLKNLQSSKPTGTTSGLYSEAEGVQPIKAARIIAEQDTSNTFDQLTFFIL
jgi:hypothetical protein